MPTLDLQQVYTGAYRAQWHNKARHLPIFVIRHGSASIKPQQLLRVKFKECVHAAEDAIFNRLQELATPTVQTIKLSGRPLRMLWQASAFSRGKS